MKNNHRMTWAGRALTAFALLLLVSCSRISAWKARNGITAESLLSEIKVLASDDFEGRKPGTAGEAKTVAWLEQQFRQMGLKPGNPDGTYFQKVPLAGITSTNTAEIAVRGQKLALTDKKDYIALSSHFAPTVEVKKSDVVFVGYGVVAPEYGWDDYKGVDVKGKTILMLINDPAVPDPANPRELDPKYFKGKAMTYYGRWTYKYEIASQKGAAAAIIIHETGPAGYPFEVLTGSAASEHFSLQRADNNESRVPVEAWISQDKAAELLKLAGQDLAQLKRAAVARDFQPVALEGVTASFTISNTLRKIESRNVVARVEGGEDSMRDQWMVYTAHWDHLGKDTDLPGHRVFNGAVDNASGVAGLLEIARVFARLSPAPKRSVLFLATTAEEQGLLGAQYYAEHPLYPLKRTLADINMDGLNVWGKTKDVTIIGYGYSNLDDLADRVLKFHDRTITADPEPEKGYYYRSDHFEFAKQGVPSFDPKPGVNFVGKPADYSEKVRSAYVSRDYHKPTDQVKPDWDLSGAVEDLGAFFDIGYRLAGGEPFPDWNVDSEFRSKRDAMMK